MRPTQVNVQPAYRKPNGLFTLKIKDMAALLPFNPQHTGTVTIPPGQAGGNHSHPRQEAFVALDDCLELVWSDETGSMHRQKMKNGNTLILFILPANLPHAVTNTSPSAHGTLIEFADGENIDVKRINLI